MITTGTRRAIGFDLDGTLVYGFTDKHLEGQSYPDAVTRLEQLRERENVGLFIASNQAGPVYRVMTKDPKYPSATELAYKLAACAVDLKLIDVPWYIATWHGNRSISRSTDPLLVAEWKQASQTAAEVLMGTFMDLLPSMQVTISASPQWRKPEWGMLEAASLLYDISPDGMHYVGDMESDRDAAASFGAFFVYASVWRAGGAEL